MVLDFTNQTFQGLTDEISRWGERYGNACGMTIGYVTFNREGSQWYAIAIAVPLTSVVHVYLGQK